MSIELGFSEEYVHLLAAVATELDRQRLAIGPYVSPAARQQIIDFLESAARASHTQVDVAIALQFIANVWHGLQTGGLVAVHCVDQSPLAASVTAMVKRYGDQMPEPLPCFDGGVGLDEYPGGPPFWLLAIQ